VKLKYFIIAASLMTLLILMMAVKNARTPQGLGVNEGQLAALPGTPNAVSSQTGDTEKRVDPFPFKGDIKETKRMIKQALQDYGNIEIEAETDSYIHAVSTTRKMKYHDDLEFYFDEKDQVVHFRSASRVGKSDLGLNSDRYNHLMESYKQQQ
jgi:uncharacterized protein (DUF1499 family)